MYHWYPSQINTQRAFSDLPSLRCLVTPELLHVPSVPRAGIGSFRQATHHFQQGTVCEGEGEIRVSGGQPRVGAGRGDHKPTREGPASL